MDFRKFFEDVLEGTARVVTFDNAVSAPDKVIDASALSALNFVRLAFAAERRTPILSQLLASLYSRQMVENAVAISREWPSGVHTDVEDVYRVPLFEMSLKLVSTDYDSPSRDHIATLLENLCSRSSSAAILMTRSPDVIACLRLHVSARELFVLFNPQPASEHQQLASLTFTTSLLEITKQLCDIFPLGKVRITQGNLEWQAKLLEKCAGHMFVPRAADQSQIMEDSLILSSLSLLTLRAELEELERENRDLKGRGERLERSVADLQVHFEEEKAKTRRAQSSKSSMVNANCVPSVNRGKNPQATHCIPSTRERRDHFDGKHEVDPSIRLAHQLQATFDSENEFLLMQRYELTQTAQRHYHCGVCLDDFPEDDVIHIDACGHEICRDCARGHVCTKIEERRFPVLCPVCMVDSRNKNPGAVSGSLVQLLGVSEKQWEIWVEMEIARYSTSITCRKCHHFGFVDRQDLETSPEIQCPFPGCNHVWCKKCQQTIDQSGPKHSCDGTLELDHLMKQNGWRYCPNCKTPIQKTQGCNHLSCIAPGCNTHFCYGCGKVMRASTSRSNATGFCTC